MESQMTPQQALQILDQIVSQVPMSRKDHQGSMEALRVLKEASEEKPSD